MSENTSSLIDRMILGDATALAAFHERTFSRAFAVARQVMPSDEAALKVVEQTFVTLWQSATRTSEWRSEPESWLFAMVHTAALTSLQGPTRSS